jgi:hypothetical protein
MEIMKMNIAKFEQLPISASARTLILKRGLELQNHCAFAFLRLCVKSRSENILHR